MFRFYANKKQSQTYSKQMRREVMFLTGLHIELVRSTLFSMIDMIMVGLSSAAISLLDLLLSLCMVLLAVFSAVNVVQPPLWHGTLVPAILKRRRQLPGKTIVPNFVMGIIVRCELLGP